MTETRPPSQFPQDSICRPSPETAPEAQTAAFRHIRDILPEVLASTLSAALTCDKECA